MESGDWIGLSALAVALLSFFANAYFTRNERQTRVTEINLLRRQVEGEADERDERRRARIAVEQSQVSGGERADGFTFFVTNLGPAVVRDVDLKVRTLQNEDATPRLLVATGMLVGDDPSDLAPPSRLSVSSQLPTRRET
jgi:hypothetical protein